MDENGEWRTRENVVKVKSFAFAVRVVKLARFLQIKQREFVISKQVVRCGTAIGALVREAEQAESKLDFTHKMAIALKEANETIYWLELLHATDYLDRTAYESIYADNEELLKLLISIVKSSRRNAHAK
jgi:four helix bundle protein